MHILGVRKETIDRFNLTSEEVAREMVQGALQLSEANVAVANTGVAGPGTGDGGIPVGTVCFAWAFRLEEKLELCSETRRFDGDRNTVRQAAAEYAITRISALYETCTSGMRQSQGQPCAPAGRF